MPMIIVFSTLALALVLFAWGKVRHDVTGIICLLVLVFTNVVPADEAFMGFAHPAVITVAMVLIVSSGLKSSGLIETVGHWIMKLGKNRFLQITVLCVIVCIASAFMNNVGALAIIMPVAIHVANKNGHSPSFVLMPIAFASLLGGMTTLIGTPPNIIIATYRADAVGEPFSMFDFAPVGVGVSIVGLLFITIIGWRFIPKREAKSGDKKRFKIEDYITEVEVLEESKINGSAVHEIEEVTNSDIRVLNVIRNRHLIQAPHRNMILKAGDIVTVEAESEELKKFVQASKAKLVGKEDISSETEGSGEIGMVEAVVTGNSPILGRTAASLRMRSRFEVNLLAVARQDQQIRRRLDHVIFKTGDVLLLQGDRNRISDTLTLLGCLPLADRDFSIGKPREVVLALSIFMLALVLVVGGIVKVQVAFTVAALLMVLTKVLPLRNVYTSIDWPVIVLIGALLPVGTALEKTGGASFIANQILGLGDHFPATAMLVIVLVGTMFLSDIINNAATVVLMAPVALNVASGLSVSPDPFLMAVAVGGSCAFLTPIGHQSNTLVMGPGGYKFTDYWRMGLPLEILIVLLGTPLILHFWPL
jgi:di/tricarboxylate transporter